MIYTVEAMSEYSSLSGLRCCKNVLLRPTKYNSVQFFVSQSNKHPVSFPDLMPENKNMGRNEQYCDSLFYEQFSFQINVC